MAGGSGADTLWGGKGADRFIFSELIDSTAAAKGRDQITDFSHAQHDRFDVSAIDANTRAKNDQEFNFIGDDRFSKSIGELRYAEKGDNTIVSGDINGDGEADFSLLISGHRNLMKSDFLL